VAPRTDSERLAALEEAVKGIQADLELQRQAWTRRSEEFHTLELAVNAMTTTQQNSREAEARQYRRLEFRIQVLTLVLGCTGILSPVVIALVIK
jgi:hypothetical protein